MADTCFPTMAIMYLMLNCARLVAEYTDHLI